MLNSFYLYFSPPVNAYEQVYSSRVRLKHRYMKKTYFGAGTVAWSFVAAT